MTPTPTYIVHRQEYRPARHGGKYHVRTINGVAACRGTIEVIDTRDFLLAGEKPHPIICRRCLAQESEK